MQLTGKTFKSGISDLKRVAKLLFLSLQTLLFFVIPKAVFAVTCTADEVQTDFGCIPNTPAGFTSKLYGYGLGMIGVVGLLFIVFGGYLILTSQGNPEQLRKGRSYITYSIIGIVLAIAGFAFYQIVTVDVLKIPGFNR